MTIWHTLSTAAASTPGVGSLLTLLQRIGALAPESDPASAVLAVVAPQDSTKFSMAIIALSAKLARSDGAVTLDEVEAFKRIMSVPEGEDDNVRRLFNLAKQDVAGFEAYARQIGALLAGDRVLAREVLDALLVIAAADNVLHDREDAYLRTVSGHLGLSEQAYIHARGLYFAAPMGAYETLGLEPDAADGAIKARHRQLVKEHHPDRLAGLGCTAEHVARAESTLARINAAYDVIVKERGL
ncbi:MAG: TerB family tellurite resistance protein [Hyphomicrobiaceae bacterium]